MTFGFPKFAPPRYDPLPNILPIPRDFFGAPDLSGAQEKGASAPSKYNFQLSATCSLPRLMAWPEKKPLRGTGTM